MIFRALGFLTLMVGWALVAATGLAIWLHYYPSRGDLALYLTSAVPFALVAGAVAILLFAAFRRWFMLLIALVVTAGVAFTQAPLFIARTAPTGGEPITVMSSNVLFGGADIDELAERVRSEDVDFLSLQEVTAETLDRVRRSSIGAQLPHIHAIPGVYAAGTAMLSRFPLTEQAEVPDTVLRNLTARTDLPGAPATQMLALHPAAPLRGKVHYWVEDMEKLDAHLAAMPGGRAIAAGDFNSTWDHARFRGLLRHGFQDATDQSGAGFQPSYPTDRLGHRPFIAIDHVIVRGFVATSLHTFTLSGSDHRSVVVTLVPS
ncbi:endonuclease/exonuclease/phosphatase family protein [Gordonia soli]|uniref:Endonuclease/exonuclease/phosphatase domain-containing protein n=1 Tax=Gordonia soli NBRC 108243 TaxID=1223545 RepID=M0QPW4_9ACTN|nr:endonuclease/exonuclease/phosphatase family protein [Gordonia soli]GAC69482.1 hypothetical protein GS4_25_00530 [Gordonia soli NBRC 108243]